MHDHVHPGEHDHRHPHGHSHGLSSPARTDLGNARRLLIVFCLVAVYTVAEAVGGLLTGSLALLADASHMLSDVAALGIALMAIWLARRPASRRRTFGFYRAEVLGALINGVVLIVLAVFIAIEAFERFSEPHEILAGGMLLVATGGLVVNLVGLALLHGGHNHSLNVRGAWLHMMADTLGSLGAMISAGLIWRFGWTWADPAASVVIAALVLASAVALLRDTVRVLMEEAPKRLDPQLVGAAIEGVDGVCSVHDLHLWTIGSGREVLTAHVVHETTGERDRHLLAELRGVLSERFDLEHVTLQLERAACQTGSCDEESCVFEQEEGR